MTTEVSTTKARTPSKIGRLLGGKRKKENVAPEKVGAASDAAQLAARVGELESELTQARMDGAALRSETDKLKRDLSHANKRKQHLKSELEKKKRRVEELEAENADLAGRLRTLSARNWRDFASGPVFSEAPIADTAAAAAAVGTDSVADANAGAVPEGRFGPAITPTRRARAGSFDVRMLQSSQSPASKYSTLSQYLA